MFVDSRAQNEVCGALHGRKDKQSPSIGHSSTVLGEMCVSLRETNLRESLKLPRRAFRDAKVEKQAENLF